MTRPTVAGTFIVAFLVAACGQYAGVHEQAVFEGEVAGITSSGLEETSGTSQTGGGSASSGVEIASTDEGTGSGAAAGGGGGGAQSIPTSGDSTGITSTTITVGIHAPLTGAAPLRAESFVRGKDLYWQHGNNGKPVLIGGRRVEVVFHDDQYNPSHARDVCQQMAEEEKAFLLIGGGGTDQMQACAQYAASRGIPYVAPGFTEIGVRELENHFALSMSYPQQGPLLAEYIKASADDLGWGGDAGRIALVATDTPNFDDAVDAFVQAMPGVQVYRPAKNERGSSMAANLCTGNVANFDVVYPLVAPTYYLEMAGAAQCHPQYVGVGITMGLDQVANTGCQAGGSTEGARFFSPAPAFVDSDDFDEVFRQAGGRDDIEWLFWGIMKSVHSLLQNTFEAADGHLTREGFIAASEQASEKTGVFPDVAYTSENHMGARQVNVLRNVCTGDGGHFVTEAAFKSSF